VLVAIDHPDSAALKEIYQQCVDAGIVCRVLSGITAVVAGRALTNQIRDISIEDLLGREPVTLDDEAIMRMIVGQVVLVTGAAGSIGSEMCRQIARFQPAAIVGFETAETPLFFLKNEMKKSFPFVTFHGEIGSIRDGERLGEVMQAYRPAIVFHAAAYKHVPMMEANPFEAVANNIFGTETVVRTAAANSVKTLVMISTDKAVRPTNVMGTTKRIAELLVNALSSEKMVSVSVRFGNVLGSNGSVIPIFQQQIAAGGPVTVTHPEMRRYFMMIPEAAQLVLQAAAIGKSGQILVLEMGEPVKIVELAHNLIRLAGLRPDVDIGIEFTGVRPGEKLYEEINLSGESMIATSHRKIKVFKGAVWTPEVMRRHLARIRDAWEKRDQVQMLEYMKDTVPEYTVNQDLLEAVPETGAPSDGTPAVTLMGRVDAPLAAEILEVSGNWIRLSVPERIPLGSALAIRTAGAMFLAEVSAVDAGEDGRFIVSAKTRYRLPGTSPDRPEMNQEPLAL
jgi:FlaA1/EpsC-like NDP-sugar epimerase